MDHRVRLDLPQDRLHGGRVRNVQLRVWGGADGGAVLQTTVLGGNIAAHRFDPDGRQGVDYVVP